MKSVLFCLKMPHGTYIGGVATVINGYMEYNSLFLDNGYSAKVFDYVAPNQWEKIPSKVSEVLYGLFQRKSIDNYLANHKVDIVHIHTSREWLFFKDMLLAKHLKKKFNVKVVVTIHVGASSTVFNRIGMFRNKLLKIMNKDVSKNIFLSKAIQNEFISLGLDEKKTSVLYNYHNMTTLREEDRLKRVADLHLLFVGALHREKGILELLQAVDNCKHKSIHLDVCGLKTDISIEKNIDKYKNSIGEKITFHGYVNGSKKTALFKRADILILPSYHEGMPLVVLEALSQGCAVISTKVGSTPEILIDSRNVVWIEVGSSENIEASILKLYYDRELLAKMKKNNEVLGEQYTLLNHIDKLCKIFQEC